MKTTLDIPDDLLRRAKQVALDEKTSLKAIVSRALERELGPVANERQPVRTHVCGDAASAGTIQGEVVLRAIRQLRDGTYGDTATTERLLSKNATHSR